MELGYMLSIYNANNQFCKECGASVILISHLAIAQQNETKQINKNP